MVWILTNPLVEMTLAAAGALRTSAGLTSTESVTDVSWAEARVDKDMMTREAKICRPFKGRRLFESLFVFINYGFDFLRKFYVRENCLARQAAAREPYCARNDVGA